MSPPPISLLSISSASTFQDLSQINDSIPPPSDSLPIPMTSPLQTPFQTPLTSLLHVLSDHISYLLLSDITLNAMSTAIPAYIQNTPTTIPLLHISPIHEIPNENMSPASPTPLCARLTHRLPPGLQMDCSDIPTPPRCQSKTSAPISQKIISLSLLPLKTTSKTTKNY